MKRIILTFLVLSISMFSEEFKISQGQVLDVATTITKEKYPNSNMVMIDGLEVFEYQMDGTSKTVSERYMKILDEDGKNQMSEQSLSYDENYGNAKYEFIKIIKPDGNIINVDFSENMDEKINPHSQSANIYNSKDKIIIVNIPKLEVGDIIYEKSIEIITKPLINNESDFTTYGENFFPIIHSKSVVIAPKGNPIIISKVLDGQEGKYTLEEKNEENKIYYIFTVNNVSRIMDEPNMPSLSRILMRWKVSTISEWEDLGKWYYDLTEPKLLMVNQALKYKTKELIKYAETDKEKYKKIYFWVSRNIRYMGETKEDNRPGFEPHNVSYTFNTRTGVCRDKAALIVAMLREAGFEAYMVLINASRKIDIEVPLSEFNHAIATVVIDGEYILIDPTSETSKNIFPEYLMNKSYIVAKKDGSDLLETKSILAIENSEIITTNVIIKDGLYIIERKIELKGFADIAFRGYLTRINQNEIKELFKYYAKNYSQDAKLISYNLEPKILTDSEPLVLTYKVESQSVVIGKKYKMVPLKLGDSLFIGKYLRRLFTLPDRKHILKTDITGGVIENINIEIDNEFEILALPENIELKENGFYYKLDLKREGNVITGKVTKLFKNIEYEKKDYKNVRKLLSEIQKINKKEIIIEKR